jgi:hypothetical protein
MLNLKKEFENNGYIIIKNFISSNNFIEISNKLNKDIESTLTHIKLKKFGGYQIGNINVNPGKYGRIIWNILIKNKLDNLVEKILDKKIKDYFIQPAGNLSLPKKGNQNFHTDGKFNSSMYLISVATSNIDENCGPTEIVKNSHTKNIPYWKFLLNKKKIEKILLKEGDLIIRKHSLWHRGTKNNSNNYRFLLTYLLFDKGKTLNCDQFNNDEHIKLYDNFFSGTIQGRLKEFIYVKLNFIFIIYKFIRSFF